MSHFLMLTLFVRYHIIIQMAFEQWILNSKKLQLYYGEVTQRKVPIKDRAFIEKNGSVVRKNWITKSPAIYEEEIGKECWARILPDKIKSCIALRVTQLNIVSIADCKHFALGIPNKTQNVLWVQFNAIATIEPCGQILLTNWVCLRGTGHWPHHRWQCLCLGHCLLFTSYPPLKTSDCSCKYPPHVLHMIAHENK